MSYPSFDDLPHPLRRDQIDLPANPDQFVFNPTFFETNGEFIGIYRRADEAGNRSIASCRLSSDLRHSWDHETWPEEPGQDKLGAGWRADPRAFRFKGRNFVTYNSGHKERPNNIYLIEVDDRGQPRGPKSVLVRREGRQEIEKNWGFFEHDGALYCIYSLSPFSVMRVDIGHPASVVETVATFHWHSSIFESAFGILNGGASPVRVGDLFVVVAQSRVYGAEGWNYFGNLFAYEAEYPFKPRFFSPQPLFPLLGEEIAVAPASKLNPRINACLYPTGASVDRAGEVLQIAYGINDYRSGVREYRLDDLRAKLVPVVIEQEATERSSSDKPSFSSLETFFWVPRLSVTRNPEDLSRSVFRFGNAGDAIQGFVNSKLFGLPSINGSKAGPRLLGCGSIAHTMRAHDVIWGSGFKDRPPNIDAKGAATVRALAVRGPLTLAYLQRHGVDTSAVDLFFDPGSLIADIFADEIAELRGMAATPSGILYLPHYRDTIRFRDIYGRSNVRIGSMDANPFQLFKEIIGAELVVSSSLHGVIFAEALGVPALLHQPPAGEVPEKYEDYYLGTGRPVYPVVQDGISPASFSPPDLPRISPDWRRTIPSASFLLQAGLLKITEGKGPGRA